MKRAMSFVLSLALVLGSFTGAFADTTAVAADANSTGSSATTSTSAVSTSTPAVQATPAATTTTPAATTPAATTTAATQPTPAALEAGVKTPADVVGTEYEDAVTALITLGVVNGNPDGSYLPMNTLNRAEAAKLIISALGLEAYVGDYKNKNFVDLDGYNWAAPYIAYAESLNIIKGVYHDRYFPGSEVTYEQFITMLLRACGYTDACLPAADSWPINYITKAKTLGLLEDVTFTQGTGANRGDVARLIYAALDLPIGFVDGGNEWHAPMDNTGNPADTMLIRLSYSIGKDAKGANYAMILTDMPKDSVGRSLDYARGLNFARNFGAYVVPYINSDGEIVGIAENKSVLLTGEFTSKAGVLSTFKTVDGVEYDITATTFSGVVRLDNNREVGRMDLSAANVAGRMTIAAEVSGKKIKDIYSANYWQGEDYIWTKADTNMVTNRSRMSSHRYFDLDEDEKVDETLFLLNGVSKLADIREKNIVTLFFAADGETITRMDVSQKTANGEVTKYVEKKKQVTIGGKDYEFVDYRIDGAKMPTEWIGSTGTFYLNYEGKIVNFKGTDQFANYALIVDDADYIKSGQKRNEWIYKVKIMNSTGAKKEYTIDKDATIKVGGNVYKITTGAIGATSDTALDLLSKNTFIAYSLSKDKITIEDIIIPDMILLTGSNYNKAGIIGGYEIDANCNAFIGTKGANWSVKKYTSLFTKTQKITQEQIYAYVRDEVVVALRSNYPITSTTYGYFYDWSLGKDSAKDDVYVLKAYYEGASRTLYTEDDSDLPDILKDDRFPLLEIVYAGTTFVTASAVTPAPIVTTVTSVEADKDLIKTPEGYLETSSICKYYEITISDDGETWTMKPSSIKNIDANDYICWYDWDTKKSGVDIVTFCEKDFTHPAVAP